MTNSSSYPRPFGRYELLEPIAAGGMGEVYRARLEGAEGWQKPIAIKTIHAHLSRDPDTLKRFVDEAKIAVTLTHGNIVPILDLGVVDGELYIAMEHVDGWDLRAVRRALGEAARLPDTLALYICAEVAQGLAYAHTKRDAEGAPLHIVHRDISPSNILLSRDGIVRLTDFGVATAALREESTATGQIRGKFSYMSPEQAAGEKVDARSDVFSLGVVLYELLTGVRPFDGERDVDTLARIQRGECVPVDTLRPALDPALAELVHRALARDRDARVPSAQALADALRALLHAGDEPPSAQTLARHLAAHMPKTSSAPEAGLDTLLNAQLNAMLGQAETPAASTAGVTVTKTPSVSSVPIPTGELTPTPTPEPVSVVTSTKKLVRSRIGVPLWLLVPVLALAVAMPTTRGWLRGDARVVVSGPNPGATLWIDGEPQGYVPVEVSLRPGAHEVRVEEAGFVAFTDTREARRWARAQWTLPALEREVQTPEAEMVVIQLAIRPAGAEVTFNGRDAGPAQRLNVLVGEPAVLVVEAPGYAPQRIERTFTREDALGAFPITLEPLPAPEASGQSVPDPLEVAVRVDREPTPVREHEPRTSRPEREVVAPHTPSSPSDDVDAGALPEATLPHGHIVVRVLVSDLEMPSVGTVSIDGEDRGRFAIGRRYEVPVGEHEVRMVNGNYYDEVEVLVTEGETAEVLIDWR